MSRCLKPQAGRYRNETAPFEWLESFAELESLIKEAAGTEPLKRAFRLPLEEVCRVQMTAKLWNVSRTNRNTTNLEVSLWRNILIQSQLQNWILLACVCFVFGSVLSSVFGHDLDVRRGSKSVVWKQGRPVASPTIKDPMSMAPGKLPFCPRVVTQWKANRSPRAPRPFQRHSSSAVAMFPKMGGGGPKRAQIFSCSVREPHTLTTAHFQGTTRIDQP